MRPHPFPRDYWLFWIVGGGGAIFSFGGITTDKLLSVQ